MKFGAEVRGKAGVRAEVEVEVGTGVVVEVEVTVGVETEVGVQCCPHALMNDHFY